MILVTGSTGLLGGHMIYALLTSNERIAALRRPSAGSDTLREIFSCYGENQSGLTDRIDWRTGDLLDRESLGKALEGITCVVNCAAVVSFDRRDSKALVATNVTGTRNLVQAIREKDGDRPRLIHISSIAALGDGPGDDPKFLIDEETPRDPRRRRSAYSLSKYESEKVITGSDLDATVLNPGVILGPGQWTKGSSQFFVKAWEGLRYYPYGGTGYVDVRDVCSIICKIIERRSGIGHMERYCLVGENLRYREFFNLATDEFGNANPNVYAGKFMTGLAWRADSLRSLMTGRQQVLTRETARTSQRISFYSAAKIRKELQFEFRPVDETIEWVARYYRNFVARTSIDSEKYL